MEAPNSTAQFPSLLSSRDQDDEMNVYLKIVKTVPMKVKRTDTIGTLKANITQKEGISESNQKLFVGGKLLFNAQTMADCGIQDSATLHLFANDNAVLKIFIKMPSNNKIVALDAKASETVLNIKLMIQEREGILSNCFTLVYDGTLLDDGSILTSIGVGNNSTMQLVFSKKEVLTFFVKPRDMEAVKLSVKAMYTVGDVKAIVGGMIGERFRSNMNLYYNGKLLDHSKTLAFYEIKEGSVLDLFATSMQIFVKTWIGKTLTLNVEEQHTIEDIIEKSFEKLGKHIPDNVNANFSLFYAGKRLKGDKDLASYRIQHDSTLQLVLTATYVLVSQSHSLIF